MQPLAGDRIELRLLTSGPAPAPLAFTIDNPARISLDLQGTTLALPSRRKDVKMGPLDTILAAEAEGRTRVVLNLDRMVPYETRVDGNAVVVTLGAATAADAAVATFPAAAPSAPLPPRPQPLPPAAASTTWISAAATMAVAAWSSPCPIPARPWTCGRKATASC